MNFLKEYSGKKPFFMMVSHYAVHVPHAADPKLIEKYRKLPRGKHCKDADYVAVDQISHVQATGKLATSICRDDRTNGQSLRCID